MKQVGLNNNAANLLIFWIESVDLDLHSGRLCSLFVCTNAEACFGREERCHFAARQRLAVD